MKKLIEAFVVILTILIFNKIIISQIIISISSKLMDRKISISSIDID
jgi:hypothetical protein